MDAYEDPIPISIIGSKNGEDHTVKIAEVREVDAPADKVWDIISGVDRDPQYWSGLVSIRNIPKEGTLIERDVVVGFMGRNGTQRLELLATETIHLTQI